MNPLRQPVGVMRHRGTLNVIFEATSVSYAIELSAEDYRILLRAEAIMMEKAPDAALLSDRLYMDGSLGIETVSAGAHLSPFICLTMRASAIDEITYAKITQQIADHLDACKALMLLEGERLR